jgi:hypothetical protein
MPFVEVFTREELSDAKHWRRVSWSNISVVRVVCLPFLESWPALEKEYGIVFANRSCREISAALGFTEASVQATTNDRDRFNA